jgi:malonyl-CoA/methylmalonyl-CoA synthetase
MNELSIFERATTHGEALAIRDGERAHTYRELLSASARVAAQLLMGKDDLAEARVAFLLPAGFDYAAAQWAIWRAGGIAVPLCTTATTPELEYVLQDAGANMAITSSAAHEKLRELCARNNIRLLAMEESKEAFPGALPAIDSQRRGMILYTSGTTARPKGVVTTHANIEAQIKSLALAWEWSSADRIPLFLPLHHIHGIINVLSCGLWSGAEIEAFPTFDMAAILARVAEQRYTLFMAVPTIYVKLIQALESASPQDRARIAEGFAEMRLMVSGSAALPASVHARWAELTGQQLLERYGMTEIGMAISNPLRGERRPGSVGVPLPGVEVRLKSESGAVISAEDQPGEIQVRGATVFKEYWNQPEATRTSFEDGWFRTGDMAVLERGYYRILGRLSVDIIKSGGYKLSALEIEAALLEHPAIRECAVVGAADETWGEAVAAAVVTQGSARLGLDELRSWCKDRLSNYKIPKRLLVVTELPRNAMGKVTKPAVAALFRDNVPTQ